MYKYFTVASMLGLTLITSVVYAKTTPPLLAENILKPGPVIEVSISPRRFDLMVVDDNLHRLIVAHSRAAALSVIDLRHHKLIREIPTGISSGVAVDELDNKYFVGTQKGVAVINRKTLQQTGFIATPGPADAMIFDLRNDRLYVGHDDGNELWVINARHNRIINHISIPGAPELMAIDIHQHRLYLNIRTQNELVVISTDDNKIQQHWSTLPTRSPHGLALDLQAHRLYVAGHSNIISVYAIPSGRRLNDIDIGLGHVDQIAINTQTQRLYCPDHGKLVIINIGADKSVVLGSATIPDDVHSIAVDPQSNHVWIAYATKHSYIQAFSPIS